MQGLYARVRGRASLFHIMMVKFEGGGNLAIVCEINANGYKSKVKFRGGDCNYDLS